MTSDDVRWRHMTSLRQPECFRCIFYLENNSFLGAKSPAQLPDLNLSELVWADMKKFVSTKLCNNLEEVQLAIDEYRSGLT